MVGEGRSERLGTLYILDAHAEGHEKGGYNEVIVEARFVRVGNSAVESLERLGRVASMTSSVLAVTKL
jgi:hypothetical protein